jgi:tetratricopeptide (TPR) repeat protein
VKKILSIIIALFIPLAVFASYVDYIQNGNNAYKAKNWIEASQWYKKAYQEQPSEQLKGFINSTLKNGYQEYIAKGNAAYKSGNMKEALQWYTQAQEIIPNKQLSGFITKIRTQSGIDPIAIRTNPKNDGSPLKWVVWGIDAVLAGVTVVTYMDSSKTTDDYNALHSSIDDTTQNNFELLKTKYKTAKDKQSTFGMVMGITSLAVVYTVADMLFFHVAFPKEVALNYDEKNSCFKLAYNKEF